MRVLVFGASSTQGYWDSQGGWADRLKSHYTAIQMRDFSKDIPKVLNLGISDDTTAHILRRLGPEARARQNAKGISFIFQVGSNNAAELNGKPRSTTDLFMADMEKIIAQTRELSDQILIVGFPAVDEARTNPIAWADMNFKNADIRRYEDAAKQVADKAGLPFVPVHEEFSRSLEEGLDLHAHDGLHPNDAGHKLIFELVRPALDKMLKEDS